MFQHDPAFKSGVAPIVVYVASAEHPPGEGVNNAETSKALPKLSLAGCPRTPMLKRKNAKQKPANLESILEFFTTKYFIKCKSNSNEQILFRTSIVLIGWSLKMLKIRCLVLYYQIHSILKNPFVP